MQPQWRVYNKHSHGFTHTENFKGEKISIKAGEFILMDYEDAVQFKGQYFPMKMTAEGTPDPAGFKMIHLEPHDKTATAPVKEKFVCHIDGKEFDSKTQLMVYLKNFEGQTFKDEALEQEFAEQKEEFPEPTIKKAKDKK